MDIMQEGCFEHCGMGCSLICILNPDSHVLTSVTSVVTSYASPAVELLS